MGTRDATNFSGQKGIQLPPPMFVLMSSPRSLFSFLILISSLSLSSPAGSPVPAEVLRALSVKVLDFEILLDLANIFPFTSPDSDLIAPAHLSQV